MGEVSSRQIVSNQSGPHDQLDNIVRKHLAHPFQRPFARHSIDAFAQIESWLRESNVPLILDSYCGIGESTQKLATQFPQARILGIDKSADRLRKHPSIRLSDNYRLLRADVDDFWRLLANNGYRPHRHFLLYPNPWPKSSQLKRRCHGSPLFPTLLALGGHIELRSNWPLYVQEFAHALTLAGQRACAEPFEPDEPLTPFERKYRQSGHTLWRCTCTVDSSL